MSELSLRTRSRLDSRASVGREEKLPPDWTDHEGDWCAEARLHLVFSRCVRGQRGRLRVSFISFYLGCWRCFAAESAPPSPPCPTCSGRWPECAPLAPPAESWSCMSNTHTQRDTGTKRKKVCLKMLQQEMYCHSHQSTVKYLWMHSTFLL